MISFIIAAIYAALSPLIFAIFCAFIAFSFISLLFMAAAAAPPAFSQLALSPIRLIRFSSLPHISIAGFHFFSLMRYISSDIYATLLISPASIRR